MQRNPQWQQTLLRRIPEEKFQNIAFALLAAAVMLVTLFGGGEIGLSDNGDFSRVLRGSSLYFTETNKSFVYVGRYGIDLHGDSLLSNLGHILFSADGVANYPSIQLVVVRLTVAANLLWNALSGSPLATYRLWTLGVTYVLLYSFALYFLFRQIRLKKPWWTCLAKLITLFVLCDVGYVAYFNSFYGEPLQIIGLVFCAGFGLQILREEQPRATVAIQLALSGLLYGWSKFANIPVGILLILSLEAVVWLKARRKTAILAGVLAVAVLAGVYFALPAWMNRDTNFNAVFFGVVQDVDQETAQAYLSDLGLDEGMAKYAGNNAYVSGIKAQFAADGYEAEFYTTVSKVSLLRFYLTHPAYLGENIQLSLENAGMIRPFYLSNHDNTYPRFTLSHRFSLWSNLRAWLGFDTIAGNAALLLGGLALLLVFLRRRKPVCALACGTLAGIWLYLLAIPYISNGSGDLAKHMFAFVQVADLLFLAILLSALGGVKTTWPRQALLAGVSLCLLIAPIGTAWQNAALCRRPADALQEGGFIQLGTQNGRPIIWLIAGMDDDGTATLLCMQTVGEQPFSQENTNLWLESDLRQWLNRDFLQNFSLGEKELLIATRHPVLLSIGYRELATAGTHDFYCSHLPTQVGAGYGRSYQTTATDMVSLPDADFIMALTEEGFSLAGEEPYWLLAPYYNNGNMVRCVYPDGYVYFQDAQEPLGVRPVVYVQLAAVEAAGGSGTLADPFILDIP